MTGKRQEKIRNIRKTLLDTYGPQKCFLNHLNPFQLLCAVILSAQCTDKMVNSITPELFGKYPDPDAMANADLTELERILHPCGFYHAKAKHLKETAAKLVADFGGVVPRTMEELTTLPGVGRKTANVVLGDAMGLPGFPVDTHVLRLSKRTGMTKETDPEKVERDLCAALEPAFWADFSHLLILHGRTRCTARKCDCVNCEIAGYCSGKENGKS